MAPIKISTCIISFNEEKKIEDCLKSVLPFSDEIIIVDSFSTDHTVKIAKKYTKRIYQKEFIGFIKQKNQAMGYAKNDWVFSIDCDERVDAELLEEILRIKNQGPLFDAYLVNRITFYLYRWIRHSGFYPDYKIRLFNRKKTKFIGLHVHENLEVRGTSGTIKKGNLKHYSFDTLSDHMRTIERYTELGAQELFEKRKKISLPGILLHSLAIFIKRYIQKKGFLDGGAGFILAGMSFFHVWVKYAKLYVMYRAQKKISRGKRQI
jgi:glycosyltransferase involved in cell wall biosynthesis